MESLLAFTRIDNSKMSYGEAYEENGELMVRMIAPSDPHYINPPDFTTLEERVECTDLPNNSFTCYRCDTVPSGNLIFLLEPLISTLPAIPVPTKYYYDENIVVCENCFYSFDETDPNDDNGGLGPVGVSKLHTNGT